VDEENSSKQAYSHVGRLGVRVGNHLALNLYSSTEPIELMMTEPKMLTMVLLLLIPIKCLWICTIRSTYRTELALKVSWSLESDDF